MGMIANILNSTFVTSLLGAGAGAWAGAYFAQRIVERGARRERLRDEVRYANSAIALALFIANTSLSLKAQHVRGMAQGYVQLRNEFGAFEDRQRSGSALGAASWVSAGAPTLRAIINVRRRAKKASHGALHGRNSSISEISPSSAETGARPTGAGTLSPPDPGYELVSSRDSSRGP